MERPIRQLDRFAEALAASEGTRQDGDVRAAAKAIGLPAARGNSLMQALRRQIGTEQAQ